VFNLLVTEDALVPVLEFPSSVNLGTTPSFKMSASNSYDIEADFSKTGISCLWTCPPQLSSVCETMRTCEFILKSSDIFALSNFSSFNAKPLEFSVEIGKDIRKDYLY
jgi:hypothetical protein